MAGKTIGEVPGRPGVVWRGVLEGIQADQDFLRLMFDLQRTASHQLHCHFVIRYNGFLLAPKLAPLTMLKAFTLFLDHEKVMPRSLGILHSLPMICFTFFTFVIHRCARLTSQFFHPGYPFTST